MIDLTTTDTYKQMMLEAIQAHADELRELGYDPDDSEEFEVMAWIVWHWMAEE